MRLGKESAFGRWLADPALRYSFIYILLSAVWILTSDRLLALFVSDTQTMARLQSLKGLFFISLSALLIYVLLRKAYVHGLARTLENDESAPRRLWPMFMALLLFAASVLAGGMLLYQSAREEIAQKTLSTLASAAELRVAQVEAWFADAARHVVATVNTEEFLATLLKWQHERRPDPETMLAQLRALAATGRFYQVTLYDAGGKLLLSTRPMASPEMIDPAAAEASMSPDDSLLDMGNREVIPGVLLPVRRMPGDQPLAWIHARLEHPQGVTPTSSTLQISGELPEIQLTRRSGDAIVMFNFQNAASESPVSVRIAPDAVNSIAVKVLGGKSGGLEGLDYRQIPSLAYGLPIPGSAWHVIAKIDARAAYANLNRLSLSAVVMLMGLLVLGAWAVAVRYSRLIAEHRAEIESLSLAKRYEVLVKYANDCIIIVDANRRIIDVNERCRAIYGYDRDDMLGLGYDKLCLPGNRQADVVPEEAAHYKGPLLYESRHLRKDGTAFPVEISEVSMEIDGQLQIHRIIRDITERKANENRIAQLSQLSAVMSVVNHAIAHDPTLADVFNAACRACVEHGGFPLAALGLAEQNGTVLRIAHAQGVGAERLLQLDISIMETRPDGQYPAVVRAYFEQRTRAESQHPDDPVIRVWNNGMLTGGMIIAVPILLDQRPVGALIACSDGRALSLSQAELLLGEIANALSFAMHHFAEEEAKQQVEAALKQREAQLLKAEETARLGHWEKDLLTGKLYWSPQMYSLFDVDPANEPLAQEALYRAYFVPESIRVTEHGLREAISSGRRVQIEQELHFQNRIAYHATVIVPVCNEAGATVALRGTVQDVTERRVNEARLSKMASRLAQAASEYEDLYQNAPCGYHSLDSNGVFQRINDTELAWLGYARHEVIGKLKLTDLLEPESVLRFHETFPTLMETGVLRDLEQNMVCRNGSILPVLINATAIRDESGRFLMSRSTTYNMTDRKRIEREREQYMRRLAHLSRHLLSMQEEERKRLSASLHDRTSPNLAAIGLNLSTINLSFADKVPPELMECLDDIRALLEDTTASIREISADLRPPLLDYAGLVPAVEAYIYQFSKRTGVRTHFDAVGFNERPSPEVETLLFRVTQEALTNCAKHAQATSVSVTLEKVGEKIILEIRDDGTGFDPGALGKNGKGVGLGMLNMREMAEFAGGQFSVDARPGVGTSIHVEI